MEEAKRITFLDNLRAFIIFLVIALHAVLAFMTTPFPGWVHDAKTPSMILGIWVLTIDGPFLMATMFFVAGYFVLPSLAKKGNVKFVKDKIIRLGIPFVVGLAIFCPILVTISVLTDGIKSDFLSICIMFFNPKNFGHYHFWFLGVLMYFILITVLILNIFKKKVTINPVVAKEPSPLLFVGIILICGLSFWGLSVLSGGNYSWFKSYFVSFQIPALPLYAICFTLGLFAYKNSWFTSGYKPKIFPWTITYIISMLIYFYFVIIVCMFNPVTPIQKLLCYIPYNVAIISFIFMLLAIFQRYFNWSNPFIANITQSSFSTYLFHLFPLFLVIYIVRDLPLAYGWRVLIDTVLSAILCWLLGYIMKKVPLLRKVL